MQNDPPQAGGRSPSRRNRDGFVMAEGAAPLVLEIHEAALARGAKILGVITGCGELADISPHPVGPDGKHHRLH